MSDMGGGTSTLKSRISIFTAMLAIFGPTPSNSRNRVATVVSDSDCTPGTRSLRIGSYASDPPRRRPWLAQAGLSERSLQGTSVAGRRGGPQAAAEASGPYAPVSGFATLFRSRLASSPGPVSPHRSRPGRIHLRSRGQRHALVSCDKLCCTAKATWFGGALLALVMDPRCALRNQEVRRGVTRRNHHSAKFRSGISSGNEIHIFCISNLLSIDYRLTLEARVATGFWLRPKPMKRSDLVWTPDVTLISLIGGSRSGWVRR